MIEWNVVGLFVVLAIINSFVTLDCVIEQKRGHAFFSHLLMLVCIAGAIMGVVIGD